MCMEPTPVFQRVLREAQRWSIDVHVVARDAIPTVGLPSVFGTGLIQWPSRSLWWEHRAVLDYDVSEFIHEVAHIIVGTHPDEVREPWSPMLYYEYSAHRRMHLPGWSTWMKDFGVMDADWPDISTRVRGNILRNSRKLGIEAGLFKKNGEPTYKMLPVKQANECNGAMP